MPKSILVIDDEHVVVAITKSKLESLGYTVYTALDGQEALKVLKTNVPDLIFLDIQMPNMNGYTFIMEKSKVPEYAKIPVVVLTAYNEMEPLFHRYGVKSYLVKPLKASDLCNKAAEIIGKP
ncbi:MAG: response regulator [Candidatus Omnitrophica bacterium]|nr:response regulator [Candidatus Omnitrophota bacterium]